MHWISISREARTHQIYKVSPPINVSAALLWMEIVGGLALSTEGIFRERPARSLHFALSRMNITVRSKIMSNNGCSLNEL
jgi:hypothetical protein